MTIIINVLLGLCLGSFFHVILLRIKNEKELFTGRSICDSCGYNLAWFDLIPVISYCVLRGKCRKCKRNIHHSHIYAELIFAIGFGIAGWIMPGNSTLSIFMVYITVTGLGIGAVSDFAEGMVYTLIPDLATFSVVLLNLYAKIEAKQYATAGKYLASILLAIGIATAIAYIDKEKHLGYGDYNNLLLIFSSVRGDGLIKSVFFASAIGILLYIIKPKKSREIPFVPLLYYGYLITLII